MPRRTSDDSIAGRYVRAATMRPSPRGGIGPLHEARALASLHDACAALREAAGQCGRAAENISATTEPEQHGRPSVAA